MTCEWSNLGTKSRLQLIAFCLCLTSAGGCAESRPPHALADTASQSTMLPMGPIPDQSARYVLVPGDVVEVKFFYHSQLNERTPIRPDGRISLQLVDDVQASGLTPMQLDKALTEAYARHIKDPELTVLVKEFAQRQVYVGGEVHNPGLIRSQESISVLRAIFQSGGFKDTGNLESVVILRYNGTPTPEFMIVDLKTTLKHGSERQDIWLQSYDVVYVPKTYIASANQFMSEYIDKMIPIQRSIGVFWNFFPGGGIPSLGSEGAMAYAETEEHSASLRDVLFVLFWHRTTILLVACAVFIGVLVGLFLWEESYEARASILVKLGRQGMTLNAVLPPSSQQSGIPVGVRKEDVNSEIEILQNRALIEQVVTKLGPEFFFPESQPPEALIPWIKYMVKQGLGKVKKGLTEVLIAVDLKTRISLREQAILSIQDGLAAKAIRDSDVIELIFKWGSPDLAQATLEALVALYLERHVETHRSSEAPAFLHKQVDTIKARLQDSEERLAVLKQKQNITNFGDQQKFLLGETTKFKALLKQAETEQAEVASRLTQLRERLKSQPEYVEVTKDQARNTLLDSLKQRLLDLDLEKMKLEARFESTSRPVREVEDKIQEVKSRLSQESTRVMDRVTTGLNAVYQETRKDMLQSEVALNALQVKHETLRRHLDAYTKELEQLQSYDMELNRLQRQIKLDEESFVLYKRKLEESEISTLLDAEKVVNVRVVEPALAGAVPVNQKKKSLIVLLGGVVSLFVGVCAAYLLEYIDHSLRSPEHVSRYLGLRVLASIEEAKG